MEAQILTSVMPSTPFLLNVPKYSIRQMQAGVASFARSTTLEPGSCSAIKGDLSSRHARAASQLKRRLSKKVFRTKVIHIY